MNRNDEIKTVCAALMTPQGVIWPFGVDRAEAAVRILGLRPGDYYTPPRGSRRHGGVPLGRDARRRLAAVASAVASAAGGYRTLGTAPMAAELASAGFGRGETPRLSGDEEVGHWADLFRAVSHDGAGLSAAVRLAARAGVYPVPARGGLPPQEFVDVRPVVDGVERRWSF